MGLWCLLGCPPGVSSHMPGAGGGRALTLRWHIVCIDLRVAQLLCILLLRLLLLLWLTLRLKAGVVIVGTVLSPSMASLPKGLGPGPSARPVTGVVGSEPTCPLPQHGTSQDLPPVKWADRASKPAQGLTHRRCLSVNGPP